MRFSGPPCGADEVGVLDADRADARERQLRLDGDHVPASSGASRPRARNGGSLISSPMPWPMNDTAPAPSPSSRRRTRPRWPARGRAGTAPARACPAPAALDLGQDLLADPQRRGQRLDAAGRRRRCASRRRGSRRSRRPGRPRRPSPSVISPRARATADGGVRPQPPNGVSDERRHGRVGPGQHRAEVHLAVHAAEPARALVPCERIRCSISICSSRSVMPACGSRRARGVGDAGSARRRRGCGRPPTPT